ncbi:MAG: PQQ-binding-like beta-propeller repeat protein [Akkermansiaceae bacterium]|nr:PQQ-binding-like beta-propeller repeat protein [Akkermansiaceae bacterium]MCP5549905.1 PQQ-binding-like beta-propeller repeat protein [Akkermansiaceae bacterium]
MKTHRLRPRPGPSRPIFIIAAVAAGFLALALRGMADDWPAYRADAARSGFTAEPIPNQLTLRWVFRSPHPPRPAWPTSERIDFDLVFQPIVVGDLVIFGSSADDRVRAIDAVTGALRWDFHTGAPVRFAPFAWEDRVFVAGDDGWLYALALADGSPLWKFRGGPDKTMVLGNERLVSKWPARGGPVVVDGVVYFAAGIWPSDGVYLHALNAKTGEPVWSNGETGRIFMAQPHGGAEAESGVAAQGYLAATETRLLVPTGRAVPAVFDRADGSLSYYRLQENQHRGGTRTLVADRFFANGGCLFDLDSGEMASQIGLGPGVAVKDGMVLAEGKSLKASVWRDAGVIDRKGQPQKVRRLEETRLAPLDGEILDFIVAGGDAICGLDGRVSAIDYTAQRTVWWSREVEGRALGLAAGNGRLVVSTDRGLVYCFDGEAPKPRAVDETREPKAAEDPAPEIARAADEILRKSGIRAGYCVDLGAGTGDLALALAKKSDLRIYAVENDPALVAVARRRLAAAGLYGDRVTVHLADPAKTGYPRDFANLVVSSRSVAGTSGGPSEDLRREMRRLQRPFGGTVCTGPAGGLETDVRGDLEGAGSWTHQNSNAANTLCSDDTVIRGPLSMFWFRDVDFEIPNRHGQGPAPLVHRGHLVVGGVDGIACLDAFNGRTLWIHQIDGNLADFDGIHHDVGVGEAGSNFCLGDDAVYLRAGDRCLRIGLDSGEVLAEFRTPAAAAGDPNRNWGFLAYHDGLVFGSVLNDAHRVSPRYKLTGLRTESTALFALDAGTGELKWRFDAKHSIRNNAIAVSGDRVYLIDRPLVEADHVAVPTRNGRHGEKLAPEKIPPGGLVALDRRTGAEIWRNEDNIFGTQLAVSETHGTLLMNYEAVRHNFFALPSETGGRLAGFDIETGKRRWDRPATYQTRPLINDYTIYAQGGAWNLITGEPVPFEFERSYGCGQIASSRNLMLFRSATLGYRDLTREAGTENFGGIRPSCWINAIPANGLVLVPDGSSKCHCSYQMKAWFALQPAGD